jgi:hypothetical protein
MKLKMPFGLAMHTYDWIIPGYENNINDVQKHILYLIHCNAGLVENLKKYSKELVRRGYKKEERFAETGV